ncbi:MAG: universal stress protein [Pseudomonadota bacterium]
MKNLSRILFVASPETDNLPAFEQASTLASHHQAELVVLGVVDAVSGHWAAQVQEALIQDQQAVLDNLVAVKPANISTCSTRVRVGKAFVEIIREVQENPYDLVVKAPEQPMLISLGSTDRKLLRQCPSSLLLAHPRAKHGQQKILLAVDHEPDNPENEPLNQSLIDLATCLAISEFAQLHVLHVWHLEHEGFLRSARSGLTHTEVDNLVKLESQQRHAWLAQFVERHCTELGNHVREYLNPEIHVLQGSPREVVAEFANDEGIALIVMGTVARTGIQGFVIGNTAEHILNHIDCAVLAVKPAGFSSPVL